MGIRGHIATVDAASMRAQNASLLLNLIWRARHISRAEIARRTGLSPSTVSAIVSDLERSSLVRDTGTGASRGGRKPVLVGFCDDAFAVIGVEVGARHVATALTDLRGKVLGFRQVLHPVRNDPEGTLSVVRQLIKRSLDDANVRRNRLVGIGVAVPSPVHPAAPGKLSQLILPAWRDYDVQAALQESYKAPVFVDNDANLGALAERWWGAGMNGEDLTYIKVGTGIGSGHIIAGELYRGVDGTAGEIGHIPTDPNGPKCLCGNRGCLVTFVGSEALVARARKFPDAPREPRVADIVRGARAGEGWALTLIAEVGQQLGIVIGGLLNMLNPAIVVIGGEITGVHEILLGPLREMVRSHGLSTPVAETRIVTSGLGERAIAVGAATLVLAAALRDRTLFPLHSAEGVA